MESVAIGDGGKTTDLFMKLSRKMKNFISVMFTVIQNTRSLIKNSAAVFIAEHRLVN